MSDFDQKALDILERHRSDTMKLIATKIDDGIQYTGHDLINLDYAALKDLKQLIDRELIAGSPVKKSVRDSTGKSVAFDVPPREIRKWQREALYGNQLTNKGETND